MKINLDEIKTFYDPHPGFGGAMIPMPSAVKKVADELNGKTMALREAIAKLQAVTEGTVMIKEGCAWISFEICTPDNCKHFWRVIRFK